MKVSKLTDNILLFEFKEKAEMAKTFLRFQEHYESPEFKGKVFTVDEFKAWYTPYMKKKRFTYYSDWEGFNVPSYIFKTFLNGNFDPLSDREKALLAELPNTDEPFYVIGTLDGDNESMKHELAHAMYYTDENYKKGVQNILLDWSKQLIPLYKYFNENCYDVTVYADEANAYLIADYEVLIDDEVDVEKTFYMR